MALRHLAEVDLPYKQSTRFRFMNKLHITSLLWLALRLGVRVEVGIRVRVGTMVGIRIRIGIRIWIKIFDIVAFRVVVEIFPM